MTTVMTKPEYSTLAIARSLQHTTGIQLQITVTMESSRGPPRVKNKQASQLQISAEQLLREAVDRQEPGLQAPTQRFADLEELHEFQGRKRKEFEDYVRRNRINMNNWMRYAQWELEQKEFRRCVFHFEEYGIYATSNFPTELDPFSNVRWMLTLRLWYCGCGISRRR
jgi:hypothetical protein